MRLKVRGDSTFNKCFNQSTNDLSFIYLKDLINYTNIKNTLMGNTAGARSYASSLFALSDRREPERKCVDAGT